MTRININNIKKLKNLRKIKCLTAYTSSIAKIIDPYVDIILIGDSVGTAIYGMKNTRSVTLEMMKNPFSIMRGIEEIRKHSVGNAFDKLD